MSGEIIRYAFIAYLGLTILDCLQRRGFLTRARDADPRPLSTMETTLGVTAVGIIATFLGGKCHDRAAAAPMWFEHVPGYVHG